MARAAIVNAAVVAAIPLLLSCAGNAPAVMLDASGGRDQSAADTLASSDIRLGDKLDGPEPDAALPPTDSAPAADSGGPPSSGGAGGAYPGEQSRTVVAGGTSFSYQLYLPKAYDPAKSWPLVSLFHGQGGSGANIRDYWAPVAESNGFVVLATTSTGTSGGWSGSQDIPRYEAAFNDAMKAYSIDTSRLYIWGFSAGAHFVHAIALMNADLFAAYAVNAGVLAAFVGTGAPAAALRKIPVSIRIGDADPMLSQARQDHDRFRAAGWVDGSSLAYSEFSGGHQLLAGDRQLAWDLMSAHQLP